MKIEGIMDAPLHIRLELAESDDLAEVEAASRLFYDKKYRVRRALAGNEEACKFKEYKNLFSDDLCSIRAEVASNPKAVMFKEFRGLLHDKDYRVRAACAANRKATELDEYATLCTDKSLTVRYAVASNPEAVRFHEFKELFKEANQKLLKLLNKNPNIHQLDLLKQKSTMCFYEFYSFEHIAIRIEKFRKKNGKSTGKKIEGFISEMEKILEIAISEEMVRYFCPKCRKFHSRGKIYQEHYKLIDLKQIMEEENVWSVIEFKNKYRPETDKRIDPDSLKRIANLQFIDVATREWFMKCPHCRMTIKESSYLKKIFKNDPFAYWAACSITHYRHDHINYYDKTWKYSRYGSYNPHYNPYYHENFKEKINKRAKRNIIRKMFDSSFQAEVEYLFIWKMLDLKNTSGNTTKLVQKYLKKLTNPFDKEEILKILKEL